MEKASEANAKVQKHHLEKKQVLEDEDKAIDEVINNLRGLEVAIKAIDEQKEILIRQETVNITDDPVEAVSADEKCTQRYFFVRSCSPSH